MTEQRPAHPHTRVGGGPTRRIILRNRCDRMLRARHPHHHRFQLPLFVTQPHSLLPTVRTCQPATVGPTPPDGPRPARTSRTSGRVGVGAGSAGGTMDAVNAPARAPLATVEAVLERLTYVNEETGYIVARVATDRSSDLLTVVGALLGAQPGDAWTLVVASEVRAAVRGRLLHHGAAGHDPGHPALPQLRPGERHRAGVRRADRRPLRPGHPARHRRGIRAGWPEASAVRAVRGQRGRPGSGEPGLRVCQSSIGRCLRASTTCG